MDYRLSNLVPFSNILHTIVEGGHSLKSVKKRARLDFRQHFLGDRIIYNGIALTMIQCVHRLLTVSRDI